MNGWEVVRRFRERYNGVASSIIVVTAAEDARKRAEEVHACCSVGKPFDADELVASVREYLEGKGHKHVA
jgi:DNA-binding response OmpR family regulator